MRLLAVDPKHKGGLLELGMLHRERGRPAEAQVLFERALAVDPKDISGLTQLGNTYYDAGRRAEAVPFYERVLGVDPQHKAALKMLKRCGVTAPRPRPAPHARPPPPRRSATNAGRSTAAQDLHQLQCEDGMLTSAHAGT